MQTTNDPKRHGRSAIGGAVMTNKLASAVLATQVAANDFAQAATPRSNIEVLPMPADIDWFAAAIRADYKAGAAIWREVTMKDFDYALDVVPPLEHTGGSFLLGEAFDHTDGDVIYCAMVRVSGRYYSRYVPRRQFAALRAELVAHLAAAAEAQG